ncbi:MAG: GTPase Era [Burkholderiales bacterium]
MSTPFRTGHAALVGRPNVGKSSLLNRVLGQKLSITSDKAQTTRVPILGIHTSAEAQTIFIDTPGYQVLRGGRMRQTMNESAVSALEQADVVVWVVEALKLTPADKLVLSRIPEGKKTIAAVNKTDMLKDKTRLLPFLEEISKLRPFEAVVPLSARSGKQVPALLAAIGKLLPEGEAVYPPDEITDRSERFLASEILREKMFRSLGEEVPYDSCVEIEAFEIKGKLRRISGAILVKREGQKAIVIGHGGERLKKISTQARLDMEALFGGKVFLEVWVKVRSRWDEDGQMLKRMGYT